MKINKLNDTIKSTTGSTFAGVSALADIYSQQTISLWSVEAMLKIKINCATYVNVREVGKVGRSSEKITLYVFVQCTPLLVEKAGVAPDVTLRFTACKQVRVQVREPPWLYNPWGGSHKVQNRGNQWLHKMDLDRTKFFLKN